MLTTIFRRRYRCSLAAGFAGTNGEVDVNECLSGPCKNGNLCTESGNKASGVAVDDFKCATRAGFTGPSRPFAFSLLRTRLTACYDDRVETG